MLSVAEATALITGAFSPLPAETIALVAGAGRTLARDIAARVTQPPADVSAMDGYAVRSGDAASVPARLRIVGETAAGRGFGGPLSEGEAVRISTGAPVPADADAIVLQEDASRVGDTLTVREPAVPGRWIRRRGLDFEAGQVLLAAGRRLTARDLGLAAAMNIPWLSVRRRPRIAFLTTGDELVMPGEAPGPDRIVSSNSIAFAAFMATLGAVPVDLGIAPDAEDALAALVAGARGADLLVTMGGASVGDHDLVRRVLGDGGFELGFYRIAMRPGKPLIFGRLGGVPVLGLPGNPVSVGVTAVVFVGAAISVMLGGPPAAGRVTAVLGCDLPANDRREDYLRARLHRDADGRLVATPFSHQDSSMLTVFCAADALVIRPSHAPPATAGSAVQIIPLAIPAATF